MAVSARVLLGRDAELDCLDDRLRAVARERGGVVAVVGPAGIGKTALLDTVADRAPRLGLAVARARGGALERSYPFGIVRQLLAAPALAPAAAAAAAQFAGTHAAAVLAPAGPGMLPERPAEEYGVFETLWWVLSEAGALKPLAVIVDDLHWADPVSLRWLTFLGRRLAAVPVVVIAGSRRPQAADDPGALRALLDQDAVEILEPAPLDEQEVGELVSYEFSDAPPGFVKACHATTGGNPFHLGELLGAARRTGLGRDCDPAALAGLGPASVARDVLERCRTAGDDALALAEAVAVLGEHATLRHAAALAGLDALDAGALVDALAGLDVLREEPPLAYAHPVLRAAVEGALSWGRRSGLHARAAELLMAEGADPEIVALHLLRAEPVGDPARAAQLRAAGRAAAARGAADAALTIMERACAEPPPAAERLEYELDLALLEVGAGRQTAEARLRAVVESDLPAPARRRAAKALTLLLWDHLSIDRVIEICRWTLERVPMDASDESVRLKALMFTLLRAFSADDGADIASLAEDLERLEAVGSRVAAYYLAGARAHQALSSNRPVPEAARVVEEFVERALEIGGDDLVLGADLGSYLTLANRPDAVHKLVEALWQDARRTGSPTMAIRAHAFAAGWALETGDVRAAEQHARAAIDRARGTDLDLAGPLPLPSLVRSLVVQGRLDEAEPFADTADRERAVSGGMFYERAHLRLIQRRPVEALDDVDVLREVQQRMGFGEHLHLWMPWQLPRALALQQLGRVDEATALMATTVRLARTLRDDRILGMCLTVQGRVEPDLARACKTLGEAVSALERTQARLELAGALHAYGSAVRRSGDHREARAPLRRALDLATACGARPLAAATRAELVMTGARPRRDRVSGADGLTEAERRVAWLAADGLSNPDIARALFVTRKTIEKTLTGVYRKLGVATRGELRAALAAEGPAQEAAP